jgi:hypothetical protein
MLLITEELCGALFSALSVPWSPLWSSGQSAWLQIQRSGFVSRSYQIFWEVVGLERGPLSFVSTTEELLERKGNGSGLENREYGRRDPSRWPCGILCPQKLVLTSPTSGGRSVGIVRSRTQTTEFVVCLRRTAAAEVRGVPLVLRIPHEQLNSHCAASASPHSSWPSWKGGWCFALASRMMSCKHTVYS